ncbi:DNA-processing protein DprA [Actinotalea sp. BY-33]|uniref:DNA-processing protein DprA n=1 Tax=Actinotalea soli TaxID=2819234 RepID=A0A939RVF0_9CELL|nr:DNA-processing protein DprA [Actinotalea soli]MBO1751553.1 DNA-processing protein DprA [Actinotalea soli]
MTGLEEVRLARAAWSRLVEPGDVVAGALVASLGPVEALAWLRSVAAEGAAGAPVAAGGLDGLVGTPASRRRLGVAVGRWAPRLATVDPARELRRVDALGGAVLIPEGPGWPGRVGDLGPSGPMCLWVRGRTDLDALTAPSVALVGARASTAYGDHVAGELAAGLSTAGWTILSGGAYGIDAMAHRGALATGGPTVAVLAGGVDRLYPAGNARLLAALVEHGAVVSEVPPGSVPSRSRFLQRNRVIAALGGATVVVEAAWRSGALSTAGHAAELLRPVGAVPGPVTSAASAGCHRLLREGRAVCVTDAAEVIELVGPAAAGPAVRTHEAREVDGLTAEGRLVLDALPLRRGGELAHLARAAGLAEHEVLAEVGHLELAGLAERDGPGWRRRRSPARGS